MSRPTVVMLAGGQNSRFFPFHTTHKGNLTLLGKPLVQRTVENLREHGYTDLVMVVSAKDMVPGGFVDQLAHQDWGHNIKIVQQQEALGMGNAVVTAGKYLTGQFAVISNYQYQAAEVLDELLKFGTSSAVCAYPTPEPWHFGILTVEHGLLKGIVEKPAKGTEPSNLAIQSLYLLDQQFLQLLKTRPTEEYNFESTLNTLAQQQDIKVLQLEESLATLKYPWHLFDLMTHLFGTESSWQADSAQIAPTAIIDDSTGPVIIDEAAVIKDFAKISGPAYIGRGALIGEYSFVRGGSIEAGVRIGANTEVVRSIIMDHSELHQSYLADSVLGRHVHAGAGLITANLRLDEQSVPVDVKGTKILSGRRKLGIMVGDHANLGIRIGTMPGVVIGSKAVVYPDQTLFRNVEHEAVQKATKSGTGPNSTPDKITS